MTTLPEEYHKLTDHAADGVAFGGASCSCAQVVERVHMAQYSLLTILETNRENARRAVYVNPDTGKAHRLGSWSEKDGDVTVSTAVCGWYLRSIEPSDDGESWCKVCYPNKAAA